MDADIRFNDDCTREFCILIVRDELRTPNFHHNLILLFYVKEVGINLRTNQKFQTEDSSIEDHLVCFPKENMRIPLTLYAKFPCFQ